MSFSRGDRMDRRALVVFGSKRALWDKGDAKVTLHICLTTGFILGEFVNYIGSPTTEGCCSYGIPWRNRHCSNAVLVSGKDLGREAWHILLSASSSLQIVTAASTTGPSTEMPWGTVHG